MKITIPVRFQGTVEIELPKGLTKERREFLAKKIVLARIVATMDNPDAPEEDACWEYQEEFGLSDETAEKDWDATKTEGVAGSWYLGLKAGGVILPKKK